MAKPKKRAGYVETWQARLGTTGLNPLMALDMVDALRDRRTEVTLDGKTFELKYSDDGKTVHYRPLDDFAPSGYLNIKRFLEGA